MRKEPILDSKVISQWESQQYRVRQVASGRREVFKHVDKVLGKVLTGRVEIRMVW